MIARISRTPFSLLLVILLASCTTQPAAESFKVAPVTLDPVRPARYARSFQDMAGDVHVMGLFKVLQQEDGQLLCRAQYEPTFIPTKLNEAIMNCFFSKPGFFLAVNNQVVHGEGPEYTVTIWRSDDDLKTITESTATLHIPEAGKPNPGQPERWRNLVFHRSILQLDDGSLIGCMYGSFATDNVKPTNPQSQRETTYKLRSFVVRSTDMGKTWNYLSTVAAPDPNKPDDTEGYNEWTMVKLNDGRILAVIRTGHFTPLVLSYSSDDGKTWSKPMSNPELGPAGCDPYLLKLVDGRIALSYGEMVQPNAPRDQYFSADFQKNGDHRRRSRLAISTTPSAEHWVTCNLNTYEDRSAYSTVHQMRTGVLLYQTDLELYEVHVPE